MFKNAEHSANYCNWAKKQGLLKKCEKRACRVFYFERQFQRFGTRTPSLKQTKGFKRKRGEDAHACVDGPTWRIAHASAAARAPRQRSRAVELGESLPRTFKRRKNTRKEGA
eukprot:625669-Pyramimonas_sp.AAC.1